MPPLVNCTAPGPLTTRPAALKFPALNWMVEPAAALKFPPNTPPALRFSVPVKVVTVPLLLKGTPKVVLPAVTDFRTVPAFWK